jgi:hypothetical protein
MIKRSWFSVSLLFAVPIVIGAFLLFQVQPLVAAYMLPWFGGASSVWIASVLFFQAFLLLGYAYAYGLSLISRVRTQVVVHAVLVAAALVCIPIRLGDLVGYVDTDRPVMSIVTMLSISIGLPYGILASTSPLLQRWFFDVSLGRTPYRYYAYSNMASLLGLLTYPFVFDVLLSRSGRVGLWSVGYVTFTIALVVVCVVVWRRNVMHERPSDDADEMARVRPSSFRQVMWVVLSALGSLLLLAITNYVTQDVASAPFLWVVPFVMYLLSFVLAFAGKRYYPRNAYVVLFYLACVLLVLLLLSRGVDILPQLIISAGALFVFTMVAHGELYVMKPHVRYLTRFYLFLALGGVLGGVFVLLVAPVVFDGYFEVIAGVLLLLVVMYVIWFRDGVFHRLAGVWRPVWVVNVVTVVLVVTGFGVYVSRYYNNHVFATRNFYGTVRVQSVDEGQESHRLLLTHGSTVHGIQLQHEEFKHVPLSYYGEGSGFGMAVRALRDRKMPLRIGVAGLGIGVIAAFGTEGDYLRFYEIDPVIADVARTYFTYLDYTPADTDFVFGDARTSLAGESSQDFDLLVLDAFSSDAVPAHLLTREAFETYLRHMRDDGMIAVNISNRYIDLISVMQGLADSLGLSYVKVRYEPDRLGEASSVWVVFARSASLLESDHFVADDDELAPRSRLWTDEYHNVLPLLRVDL